MAHGDYSCCAICDCKIHYWEEKTKEYPCVDCYEVLENHWMSFKDLKNNIENKENMDKVNDIFKECWYSPCYYANEFDEKIKLLNE